MYLAAVTDTKTGTWLKLSGIGEVHIIDDGTESSQILHSLWIREDISIIIITSNIASQCHDQITAMMKEKIFPIIIEIPSDQKEADSLGDLLKQTVGIELEF